MRFSGTENPLGTQLVCTESSDRWKITKGAIYKVAYINPDREGNMGIGAAGITNDIGSSIDTQHIEDKLERKIKLIRKPADIIKNAVDKAVQELG